MATSGTKAVMAVSGAVSTAVLSAACCLGPWVLAILGLGGAGMALALEPYRLYFLGGTALLLAFGFYHTYGRQQPPCGDEEVCALPRTNRAGRIMLWGATVIVIAVATFPEYSIHLF